MTRSPDGSQAHPERFAGLAGVDLRKPMEAVRELRRCVSELGFKGLRVIPWLWELPPNDRRYYPLLAACVELGVPFCTQVGHTGPLRHLGDRPADPVHRRRRDRLPGLVDRLRPHRLPVDRGDGRRRAQARERLHRHLGLHDAALPARARPLPAARRALEGPVRLEPPDDRRRQGARATSTRWGSTTRRARCSSAATRSACSDWTPPAPTNWSRAVAAR